jgi:hypothetical protein
MNMNWTEDSWKIDANPVMPLIGRYGKGHKNFQKDVKAPR